MNSGVNDELLFFADIYSRWKKLPVPLGVDSYTIIDSGLSGTPEQAERTICSGVFPSVFFQKATSVQCTIAESPPRAEFGFSAEPILILQLRCGIFQMFVEPVTGAILGSLLLKGMVGGYSSSIGYWSRSFWNMSRTSAEASLTCPTMSEFQLQRCTS